MLIIKHISMFNINIIYFLDYKPFSKEDYLSFMYCKFKLNDNKL